jgi:DNA-sulfur modification-associated
MAYPVIRSSQEDGLECYLLSLRPSLLFSFLRHDPRSAHWKSLTPWLQGIYMNKQRETKVARIAALEDYIINRMMDPTKFGALPPISVIQFQPFNDSSIVQVSGVMYQIEDSDADVDRVLIDGLARVSAAQNVRERLQVENRPAFDQFNNSFRFTVALYVPTEGSLSPDIAGQLFTDFNSYAWPVPTATTIANDIYNPYRAIARKVGDSDLMRRHGGLKIGKSKLGRKDVNFTTEVTMAQFCKIMVEGEAGYGALNKPVPNARVSTVNQDEVAARIVSFLSGLEAAMGSDRFADPAALFRTAHGFYALAILLHDISEGKTTQGQAVPALAAIDWTWNNAEFQLNIGRNVGGTGWRLNTGSATLTWLVRHCRAKAGVKTAPVAQAA